MIKELLKFSPQEKEGRLRCWNVIPREARTGRLPQATPKDLVNVAQLLPLSSHGLDPQNHINQGIDKISKVF